MRHDAQSFAFVTADHPDRFRARKNRQAVKRHILQNSKQLRKKNLSTSLERDEASDKNAKSGAGVAQENKAVKGHKDEVVSPENTQTQWSGTKSMRIWRHSPHTPPISPQLDRFRQLPKVEDQVVDLPLMLSEWFTAFGRCGPPKYLTSMMESEMTLTSYLLPAALARSFRIEEPARSLEYLTARQYCIQKINKGLRSPNWPKEALMSVKHLLFVDLYVGSRQTLRAHVNAIESIVRMQGGLEAVPLDGQLSNFLRVHVLWACVIANIRAPSIFLEVNTPTVPFIDQVSPIPTRVHETPLVWWSEHMSSLLASEHATPQLHSLTCELRDLSRTFLQFGSVPPASSNRNYRQILQYHSKSLAHSNTSPKSNLERRRIWIYESSRLAGLIYAAAIVYHVPISHAVSKVMVDIESSSLLEDLGAAILKSDFYGEVPVWGELIGSYLWATMVASAAGHCNLTGPNVHRDKVTLQRAIMTQPATYTMGLFHNPALAPDLFHNVKVMLKVQAMLSETPTPLLDPSLFEDSWTHACSFDQGSRPIDELYEMTKASCKMPGYREADFSLPTRSTGYQSID